MRARPIALMALVLLIPVPAHAQWSTSLAVDNFACHAIRPQTDLVAVSDGAGGVVSAWVDIRSGSRYDLYAQRTDADGFNLWPPDGAVVDTATTGTMQVLTGCPDDSGGVILVWQHAGGPAANRLLAQRIDRNGQLRWGANFRVSTPNVTQTLPQVVPDGSGGAIVLWADWWQGATIANVYGQRIDRNGTRLWGTKGDSLAERGEIRRISAVPRTGGGAYFAFWRTNGVISAAGIDANGASLWGTDSITTVPMSTAPPQFAGAATNDGVVFWVGDGTRLLARKFTDAGAAWPSSQWVATHALHKSTPLITSDGAGGVIVSWSDGRTAGQSVIYAQRMASDGVPAWAPDGERVGAPLANGGAHALSADGVGGAWVATTATPGPWVQHLSPSGHDLLPSSGVNISSSASQFPFGGAFIVPNKDGGWILAFDGTIVSSTSNDIRLKRFFANGSVTTVGVEEGPNHRRSPTLLAGPNPAVRHVTLRFMLPRADRARLEVFALGGERVAVLADGGLPAGAHSCALDLGALSPGVYHARLVVGSTVVGTRFVHVR